MIKNWGIKTRVLLLTLVPTIVISVILGSYFINERLQVLSSQVKQRGYSIASQLAPQTEFGVFSRDKTSLQRIANSTLAQPEVRAVAIFDSYGRVIASSGPNIYKLPKIDSSIGQKGATLLSLSENGMYFTTPIILRDVIIEDFPSADSSKARTRENIIGWVVIELSNANAKLQQFRALTLSCTIVLLGLSITLLFALRMSRAVTTPVVNITRAVDKIKEGKFDTRVNTGAKGELYRLESGINSMAQSLQAAHQEMQQRVEQATADLRRTLETIEVQNIELEDARKEAEALSNVKSEFLANMSHEIRTPLNGIIGFINLVLKTELSAQQRDYLTTVNSSATSLLSIINDILDFSKIEAGKLQLELAPANIREVTEQACTLLAPNAHEKNLELINIVYEDVPQHIVGDTLRIKQVITNLVNNAIKFTSSGEIAVRTMIESETAYKITLKISVTDTGIGISTKDQEVLFEAFTQADTSITRRFGGTGLGLVISKKIVELMGGDVGLESELGKGSTFWFTIECEKSQLGAQKDSFINELAGHKALLYENHSLSQLAISHILKRFGMEVVVLKNLAHLNAHIQQAYEKNKAFDVVLIGAGNCTFKDPVLNSAIKSCNHFNIIVGILCNNSNDECFNRILQEGANFVISKPPRTHDLFSNIKQSLAPPSFEYKPYEFTLLNNQKHKNNTVNNSSFNGLNILAVDDNPANLKLISSLLELMEIKVVAVGNGKAAINAALKQKFDLVFMDIQMPEMDGVEATRQIHLNDDIGYHTPIVALTAHAMSGEKENLLSKGLDDYLTKPISEKELINIIKKWTNTDDDVLLHTKERYSKPHKTSAKRLQITFPKVIDWEMTLKLSGNSENLAKQMLDILIKSIPESMREIKRDLEAKDWQQLSSSVHKFHGACCYAGVPFLKKAVQDLEVAANLQDEHRINNAYYTFYKEIEDILEASAEIEAAMSEI